MTEVSQEEDGVELDVDQLEALLAEYRAARNRVDDTAQSIFDRRAADMACTKGCSSCCVQGLAVLEVEAAEISLHTQTQDIDNTNPPPGGCAFLNGDGACTIYPVRPLVCRTHGLPLKLASDEASRGSLRVIDDVTVCDLNFKTAPYNEADILDAERIQMLLTVVNARFCANLGLEDATDRTPLSELAAALAADDAPSAP